MFHLAGTWQGHARRRDAAAHRHPDRNWHGQNIEGRLRRRKQLFCRSELSLRCEEVDKPFVLRHPGGVPPSLPSDSRESPSFDEAGPKRWNRRVGVRLRHSTLCFTCILGGLKRGPSCRSLILTKPSCGPEAHGPSQTACFDVSPKTCTGGCQSALRFLWHPGVLRRACNVVLDDSETRWSSCLFSESCIFSATMKALSA